MRLKKSSGKVLDLSMEEESGTTAYDSSRYGNDGAINGGVEWAEQGMRFDGSSGYLDCGNDPSLDITDALTISVWCKYASSINQFLLTKYDYDTPPDIISYAVLMKADNTIRFYASDNNNTNDRIDTTVGLDDNWHNIVCVFNGAEQDIFIYVDGIVSASNTSYGISSLLTNNTNLLIGARYNSGVPDVFLNGMIAGVQVYNRALTPLEIKHDYDATKYKYL